MKSLYYVANTTRVYKTAIEEYLNTGVLPSALKSELYKVSHREYTTAFFDDSEVNETQNYESSGYTRDYQFLGEILESKQRNNTGVFLTTVNVRAKFSLGEEIEIISPDFKEDRVLKVKELASEENNPINETKPNTVVKLKTDYRLPKYGILRKSII